MEVVFPKRSASALEVGLKKAYVVLEHIQRAAPLDGMHPTVLSSEIVIN